MSLLFQCLKYFSKDEKQAAEMIGRTIFQVTSCHLKMGKQLSKLQWKDDETLVDRGFSFS